MRAKFLNYDCKVIKKEYDNGRTALVLMDANDGMPIATATVNVPEAKVREGEVLIKDFSENTGMLAALTEAGIVTHTGRIVECGFCFAEVCKYTGE